MTIPQEACLLRIFIGEADKHGSKPLYEWIVQQAKEHGLAGATVLRGLMGFGANSRSIHTFKIERLSEDLPIVIELVDVREKLEAFVNVIEPQVTAGMVTLEKAELRLYRAAPK